MQLYRNKSSYPKVNAQENLTGRTHYVDDATLRFHHSRILSSHVLDEGLLFSIVESVALDMHNTKRGYRYVIFDVFGNTIDRPKLEECLRSSKAATKAMWTAVNALDAKAITAAAIERQTKQFADELHSLKVEAGL